MKLTIKRCLLGLIASAIMFSVIQAQEDEPVGTVQLGPNAQLPPSQDTAATVDQAPVQDEMSDPPGIQGFPSSPTPFSYPYNTQVSPPYNTPGQPGISSPYRLSPVDQVFVPRFFVSSYGGGLYGYGSGYSTMGAFVPYKIDDNSILFTSAMGIMTYDSKGAASVGGGFRHYMEDLDRILGLSMWFDLDNGHAKPYQQMGFSFESLGRYVDYRVNGYVPISNPNHVLSQTISPNVVLQGNMINLLQFNSVEQSYSGFDAEVGGPTPILGRYGLNAYVGGYNFSGNGTYGGNFQGVSGRLLSQINEDVSFGVQVTDDHVFGLNTQFQVFVNLPNGRSSRWMRNPRVKDKLTQNVFRQYRVIANVDNYNSYVTAINPCGNKPYFVAYINPNLATNGNGTIQSPFNSIAAYEAQTPAQQQQYSLIFVQPRNDGSSTNLDTSTTLDIYSCQRLLSTAISHPLMTANLPGETLTIPAFAGAANPVLFNSSGGNVVTLVGGNTMGEEVSGFTINGSATGNGIYGNNVLGANINNNTIQGGLNGVSLTNLSGTFAAGTEAMFVGNTIQNNVNAGVTISNNGTPPLAPLEVSVQNNKFSGNGADGLQLAAIAGASIGGIIGGTNSTTITNANIFNGNGLNGLELDANGGILNFMTTGTPPTGTPIFGIVNNTFTSNTFDGIHISTTNNSIGVYDIIANTTGSSSSSTVGNGNYGINLVSDSGVNVINIGGSTADLGNSFYGDMNGAINYALTGTNVTTSNIQGNTIVGSPGGGGSVILPGFNQNTLPANDDGSTGLVPIGFTADFFGVNFNSLYVNNNGNVTLTRPLATFTPFPIVTNGIPMLAPFFADVDTRSGNVVTYGTGMVDGHKAFGVNWPGVDHFSAVGSGGLPTNNFQLVLIDRSDIAPGDFQFEFNYKSILWESGTASGGNAQGLGGNSAIVGYTNGTTNSYQFPGSAVNGALLDSGPAATSLIHNSLNSNLLGQYIFNVQNGVVTPPSIGTQNGITINVSDTAHLQNSSITNNTVTGVTGYGLQVTTHGTGIVDNLNVSNNTFTQNGTGIQLNRDDSSLLQVILASNTITQGQFNGVEINGSGTNTGSATVTMTDETISNNAGQGLLITSAGAAVVNVNSARLTAQSNKLNNIDITTAGTSVANVTLSNTIATDATLNGLAATTSGNSILNLVINSPTDPLFTAATSSQFNSNGNDGMLFTTNDTSYLNLSITKTAVNSNTVDGIAFNRNAASLIQATISSTTANSNTRNGLFFQGLGGDPTDTTQQLTGTPNTINLINDQFNGNGSTTNGTSIGNGVYVDLYGQSVLVLNALTTTFNGNTLNGLRVDLSPGAQFGYSPGNIFSNFDNITATGNQQNGIMITSNVANSANGSYLPGGATSQTYFNINSVDGNTNISDNGANGILAQYVGGFHQIFVEGDGRAIPIYGTNIQGNGGDGIQEQILGTSILNIGTVLIGGPNAADANAGNGVNFQATSYFTIQTDPSNPNYSKTTNSSVTWFGNTGGVGTLDMNGTTVQNNGLNGVNLLGDGLNGSTVQANAANVLVPTQNNLFDGSGQINANVTNSHITNNTLNGVNIEILGRMTGNSLVFTNNIISSNKHDGFYMEQNAGLQIKSGGALFRKAQFINPPTTPGTIPLNWLNYAATNPFAYNYGTNAPGSVGLLSNWLNLLVDQNSSLQMYGNLVQYNGTQPNIALGDGVHIRVGTDTYLSADIGGAAGSTALGNIFSGNVHTDFYVESFLSYNPATFVTPIPGTATAPGTTSVNAASLTALSTVYLDDTAQLDMRFNNNSGNSVTIIPVFLIGANGNLVPNSAIYPNDPIKDYNDFPGAPNSGLPRPVQLFQVDNTTPLDTTNSFISGGFTQGIANTFSNAEWNLTTTTPFTLNNAAFPQDSNTSPGNPFLP